MTLAEVVANRRGAAKALVKKSPTSTFTRGYAKGVENVITAFEDDPDFTLRERVKALVVDLERPYDTPMLNAPTSKGIARRIRQDVLGEGKPQ